MATAKATEAVPVEVQTTGGGGLGGAAAVVASPTPAPREETNTPTPPQYTTGWAKRDPVSMAVAVRTNIPDPYSDHDWGVMTVDQGGHYASYDKVQDWADLHT